MDKRGWLDVGLRLFGAWEILAGITHLVAFVDIRYGLYPSQVTGSGAYLSQAVACLGAGLFLLIWANMIVDAVYRPAPASGPHCEKCGYSLIGLSSQVCPECGTPFGTDAVAVPQSKPAD